MAEGPRVVFGASEGCFDVVEPCLQHTFDTLEHGWPRFGDPGVVASLEAFGHFLLEHHEPPWLRGRLGYWEWTEVLVTDPDAAAPAPLSQAAYLGAAAILAVMLDAGLMMADTALNLGPLSDLAPYLARRRSESAELPELAVPVTPTPPSGSPAPREIILRSTGSHIVRRRKPGPFGRGRRTVPGTAGQLATA